MNNMLFIFDIFGNGLSTFFITLLGMILGVVLFYIYVKFPNGRIVLAVIGGLLVFGSSIYCGLVINDYYSVKGGIYGTLKGYFEKQEEIKNSKNVDFIDLFSDFTNITLTQYGDCYRATFSSNKIMELDINKCYVLLINDTPCGVLDYSTDYLSADYMYTFYNQDQEIIITDTLELNLSFYSKYTSMILKTTGNYQAVKLWNNYFSKNGFSVFIKEIDITNNQNETQLSNIDDYCSVEFQTEEETTKTLVTKGSIITLPEFDNTRYMGWYLDGNLCTNSYTVNNNVVFCLGFESDCSIIWDSTRVTYLGVAENSPLNFVRMSSSEEISNEVTLDCVNGTILQFKFDNSVYKLGSVSLNKITTISSSNLPNNEVLITVCVKDSIFRLPIVPRSPDNPFVI